MVEVNGHVYLKEKKIFFTYLKDCYIEEKINLISFSPEIGKRINRGRYSE